MLGEFERHFSLTRAALSTAGRAKSKFLSVMACINMNGSAFSFEMSVRQDLTATAAARAAFLCSAVLALGLLAAGCSLLSGRRGSLEPHTITFNASELGAVPADFTTALTGGGPPPAWAVRQQPAAPDGRPVLVQESADPTNYRFPLCIYEKLEARNVAVETHFEALSGTLDQAGGIVLRYRPENYYIARANAHEDNVMLFKTVNGRRSKIVEVPAKVALGQWHTLRFQAKGPHLTVSFDGKVVIEKDDPTFSHAGKVGLWTKADSVTAFADLKVEPLPD